jgi:hypothetical protein
MLKEVVKYTNCPEYGEKAVIYLDNTRDVHTHDTVVFESGVACRVMDINKEDNAITIYPLSLFSRVGEVLEGDIITVYKNSFYTTANGQA